jgi:transcriptional regulator of acetoin/glycerol metabolism
VSRLLKLPDVPEWLWTSFQTAPRGLRPPRALAHVLERWRRAQALGAPSEGPPAEDNLERGAPLRERIERVESLASIAAPVLARTQHVVADRGYTVLLADPAGVIVNSWAGDAFAGEAERVQLIEGADWSEASRGTNAIGTALAERAPTLVDGSAHYGRRFHGLVCYAAPVHAPDGELIGVIDASARRAQADDGLMLAITAAAQAIEAALRARAYADLGPAVMGLLGRSFDRVAEPMLLVEPPGRIARANVAARAVLARRGAPLSVQQALGVGWEELCRDLHAPPPGGRHVTIAEPAGPRVYRLDLDPMATPEGRILALLVHLEPPRVAPVVAASSPSPRPAADPFARIFAADDGLRRAVEWARRIAPSDVPVMLLAETGAGKELFAEAIHRASRRAGGPFVPVNCGALPPTLIESELFGHAPGAFTGAERQGRDGLFASAAGGTLFLDEVAEMSPAMQAALLRVLEDGRYRRVGETAQRRADVRVVCATCRDLPALVAAGSFRQDLYFRLRGAAVTLPALRARTDRLDLARHLLGELAAKSGAGAPPELATEAEGWIARQPWPGNVRELRSVLEVALVLCAGAPRIGVEHLAMSDSPAPTADTAPLASETLGDVAARALRDALVAAKGNISAVAEKLGIARSTVYRLRRKYGL